MWIWISHSFLCIGQPLTGAMVEPRVRNNILSSSGRVLHMQLHLLLVVFATRACCMLIVESGSTQAFRVTSEKVVSPQSVLIFVAISSKVQDFPLVLIELRKISSGQFLQGVKGPLSVSRPTSCYQPPFPAVYCVQTCWRGTASLPRALVKTLNSVRPSGGQCPNPRVDR